MIGPGKGSGPIGRKHIDRVLREGEDPRRSIGWVVAGSLVAGLFLLWFTVSQPSSSNRRVKYAPELPEVQDYESHPMPRGHLDRG